MDNAKNNTPKKVIISTAIGIVSMLIIIVGATYAYWNAKGSVNFNTATITYETEDKSIIVLNGTTGLLTLGTIEGTDMPKVANNIVYYAGEEDKSRTPQEVTIGVATYDEEDDENIYRCTFTLALTHGGSADLIDRFLSEGYTNRSEGQIIITVNGVEYDINDGFPSTITGYTDVDIYHPGSINVGMKFVNIGTLNQDYLIETNGHININVTSFNCQAKKELATEPPTVKYWAVTLDTNKRQLASAYPNNIFAYINNAKKYNDYHDLVNETFFAVVSPDMDSNYVEFNFNNEFATMAACENFIADFPNNDFIFAKTYPSDDWICDYSNEDNNYYINVVDDYRDINNIYHNLREQNIITLQPLFNSMASCNSFLSMVNNSNNYVNYDNYDSNTLSCLQISIDRPFFVRETTNHIRSNENKWELFYSHNEIYNNISDCESAVMRQDDNDGFNPNDKSYCLYHNGNYFYQSHLYRQKLDNESDDIDFSKQYNVFFEELLFDSESDCIEFASNFDYTETTTSSFTTSDVIYECVQTHTKGEVYDEVKLEMCLYINDDLVCFDVDDDSFTSNFLLNYSSMADDLEDILDLECDSMNKYVGDNYYGTTITCYKLNPGFRFHIDYNNYYSLSVFGVENDNYSCKQNDVYGISMGITCE